jgi:hypothetical protein
VWRMQSAGDWWEDAALHQVQALGSVTCPAHARAPSQLAQGQSQYMWTAAPPGQRLQAPHSGRQARACVPGAWRTRCWGAGCLDVRAAGQAPNACVIPGSVRAGVRAAVWHDAQGGPLAAAAARAGGPSLQLAAACLRAQARWAARRSLNLSCWGGGCSQRRRAQAARRQRRRLAACPSAPRSGAPCARVRQIP